MDDVTADLALDRRAGWPADLRHLIERYPREVWTGHANLGSMAQFWLQRHDMFREISAALGQAATAFRDGSASPHDFRAWVAPRLQFLLQQLHAHHQVEDFHYFPVFQAAEARLARGFTVLESDHRVIHAAIAGAVETANAFLGASADADALLAKLARHLRDEEDLIIPLILDRGEPALGIG
jgi:iron-sulfur cluster repair protein YtfE (RIC family)